MKKLFALLAIVAFLLPSCQKINDRLDAIDNRLDNIEGTQIASLQQQIDAINTTLPELKQMDAELKEYISNLQTTAAVLDEKIEDANDDIKELENALDEAIDDAEASNDVLKEELISQLNTAKADVLAQLQSAKSALEVELTQINATIATLQTKDAELDQKITTLEEYVNGELQNTEDWVSATFATLEQYNSISSEIATIKQNIESLTTSITELEERLNTKIANDIASAVATLNATIQGKVADITGAYTSAISTAPEEITEAYTAAIATSIANLESSMKAWVNEQLTGYYTIAETDAALALLRNELEGQLTAQKTYLEGLIENLSVELTDKIADNTALITELRNDLTAAESNIATNAEAIAVNASTILANANSIAENGANIETNKQKIAENKTLIDANATLIADNKTAITELEKSVAKNAENIAANATLIAQNATAINNNAQAVADNAAAIAQLRNDLASTKEELTEAYTEAIASAINTNNGVLRDEVAKEVATINARIDEEIDTINTTIATLTERVTTLEEEVDEINNRLDDVEDAINEIKALDLIFDIESGVACMAGASIEFCYTVVGGDNDTVVECFGDGGWSADVVSSTWTGGRIQVTAPKFGGKGKVVVLATSGAGGVCMKSIRFDEGILTDILDTYEVDYEACTLNVTLKTNLDYDLNIPTDVDWVSIANTRAEVREDVLTFSITENLVAEPRSATLMLTDKAGNTLHSFIINQKPRPVIEFADSFVKQVCVNKFDTNGDGELSYKEASKVTSIGEYFFGDYATIVKSFDELQYFVGLEDISDYAFSDCGNLVSVIIPDGVIVIGYYTFAYCHKLIDVTIPNSVTTIGEGAFYDCMDLANLILPDSVTYIGEHAFEGCSSLTKFDIPYGITEIKTGTFYCCGNLISVTIPDSVIKIGDYAFKNCKSLVSVNIPNSVSIIKSEAFSHCENLTYVTISKNITIIDEYAFYWCGNLTDVYCKAMSAPYLGAEAFYGHPYNRKIFVPAESVDEYRSAVGWSDYADNIFIGYNEWSSVKKNWNDKDQFMFTATSADGSLVMLIDILHSGSNKVCPAGTYQVSDWSWQGDVLENTSKITYNSVEAYMEEGYIVVEHIVGGYKFTFDITDANNRHFHGVIEGPVENGVNPE